MPEPPSRCANLDRQIERHVDRQRALFQPLAQALALRDDVFAFGCVLYEMVTGRRALQGEGIRCLVSYCAGIAYTICMQYTVRNIPNSLDEELRRRARSEGKSLNEVALEAMARGVGQAAEPMRFRDLSDLAGTWKEDPEFDAAVADQHTIDPELWRG